MSRPFILSLKHPHEQFGLPMSFGRKLGASGRVASIVLLGAAILFCLGVYIYQVNAAASKGFQLRALEKQLETVRESVALLEDQVALSRRWTRLRYVLRVWGMLLLTKQNL